MSPEDKAFALLQEIVQLARNGEHYRHLLADLKQAFKKAPTIARVVAERLGRDDQ